VRPGNARDDDRHKVRLGPVADQRVHSMIAGYFMGVAAALIAFTVGIGVRYVVAPPNVDEVLFFLFEFGILTILHWAVTWIPFIAVRKCGGFDNAWLSVFIGGVLTAFLMFPFEVWLFVTIANTFEGDLSYFATLVSVADADWTLVILTGALGGLTYTCVKHFSDRLSMMNVPDNGLESANKPEA
jgi:hypothetical protein